MELECFGLSPQGAFVEASGIGWISGGVIMEPDVMELLFQGANFESHGTRW